MYWDLLDLLEFRNAEKRATAVEMQIGCLFPVLVSVGLVGNEKKAGRWSCKRRCRCVRGHAQRDVCCWRNALVRPGLSGSAGVGPQESSRSNQTRQMTTSVGAEVPPFGHACLADAGDKTQGTLARGGFYRLAAGSCWC